MRGALVADPLLMDAVTENHVDESEQTEELETTQTLTQGQSALLEMLKERHDLADDRTFAMWLRVPIMRSKQKFVLAATVVVTIAAIMLLASSVPLWALAIIPLIAAAVVAAFTERDVLSFGPDGALLHKPSGKKLSTGVMVSVERGDQSQRRLLVDGVEYGATSQALNTLTDLLNEA